MRTDASLFRSSNPVYPKVVIQFGLPRALFDVQRSIWLLLWIAQPPPFHYLCRIFRLIAKLQPCQKISSHTRMMWTQPQRPHLCLVLLARSLIVPPCTHPIPHAPSALARLLPLQLTIRMQKLLRHFLGIPSDYASTSTVQRLLSVVWLPTKPHCSPSPRSAADGGLG